MKTVPQEPSEALAENPRVSIVYTPEKALATLGEDTLAQITKLTLAKITSPKTLEASSAVLDEANVTAGRLETFRVSLIESVQRAAKQFRSIHGFEDFEVTLTIKKWGLRSMLNVEIDNLRTSRARYLAAEQEKQRQAQLAAEAEQRRINEAAAKKATVAAKKAGADAETIAEIRQDVLSAPAPLVSSTAIDKAKEVGASVRYKYYAKTTDLRKFLTYCLTNDVMFNTLKEGAEIDCAFDRMAQDQKERFDYPGITYEKKPIDVSR